MDFSSFLIRQGKEGGSIDEDTSPSKDEYRESLLQALSHGKGKRQRGVLSFKSTPGQKGVHATFFLSLSLVMCVCV